MACRINPKARKPFNYLESKELPQNQWLGRLVTWLKGEGNHPLIVAAKRFLAFILAIIGFVFVPKAYDLWRQKEQPVDTKDSVSGGILLEIPKDSPAGQALSDFTLPTKYPRALKCIQPIYLSHKMGGDVSHEISLLDAQLFGVKKPTERLVKKVFGKVLGLTSI